MPPPADITESVNRERVVAPTFNTFLDFSCSVSSLPPHSRAPPLDRGRTGNHRGRAKPVTTQQRSSTNV